LLAFPALAQEQPQPSANSASQTLPNPTEKARDTADVDNPIQDQTSPQNDRLFWTLPNYLTIENERNVPPATVGQKFMLVTKDTFDPVIYPYIGFLAAISQASNSEAGYGQGDWGYAKRYGSSFADNGIGNYMTEAILPSLLHQDPRYYQLGQGGFFHRVGYTLSRIFVTRGDSGKAQFNFSEIAGNAIAAGISNTYHPAQDRTAVNTIGVWWTQIGWDATADLFKEFWPDIRGKLRRSK
jgi:hypothetical protein